MPDQPDNLQAAQSGEPRAHNISARFTGQPGTISAEVRIAYADNVIVEDSDTLKRLWRSDQNYYLVRKRVYMVVSGHEPAEITTDASPEYEAEYG